MSAQTYDLTTTLALRDAALRRHHAVLVFLVLWPTLDPETPRTVKVQPLAEYLRLDRHTVRRAISLLVRRGYLDRRAPSGRWVQYCRPARSGDAVPAVVPVRGSNPARAA
jgi:DNA-binding IclR family transcriptional regulator